MTTRRATTSSRSSSTTTTATTAALHPRVRNGCRKCRNSRRTASASARGSRARSTAAPTICRPRSPTSPTSRLRRRSRRRCATTSWPAALGGGAPPVRPGHPRRRDGPRQVAAGNRDARAPEGGRRRRWPLPRRRAALDARGWAQQFGDFAPSIRVARTAAPPPSAPPRAPRQRRLRRAALPYETLLADAPLLCKRHRWSYAVIDEAHRLKNRQPVVYRCLLDECALGAVPPSSHRHARPAECRRALRAAALCRAAGLRLRGGICRLAEGRLCRRWRRRRRPTPTRRGCGGRLCCGG